MKFYYTTGCELSEQTIDEEVCLLRALVKAKLVRVTAAYGKACRRVYVLSADDNNEIAISCICRLQRMLSRFTDKRPDDEIMLLENAYVDVYDKLRSHLESRFDWAYIDGKVVGQPECWKLARAEDWLRVCLMRTKKECETIIFGGIFKDKITIHRGLSYASTGAKNMLSGSLLLGVLKLYYEAYGKREVPVYDGCIVGDEGEPWSPIDYLGVHRLPDFYQFLV